MYKHRCGATLPTIAAAFVHLVECPLEERPASRVVDPDVERLIGRHPRQRVESERLTTRYREA